MFIVPQIEFPSLSYQRSLIPYKQKHIYFKLKNKMIQTQQHLRKVGEPQVTKLRKLWKPKKCVGVVDPSQILLTCNFCQQLTHTTALNTALNSTRPDKRRPKKLFNKIMLVENPIELFVSTHRSTCLRYQKRLKRMIIMWMFSTIINAIDNF